MQLALFLSSSLAAVVHTPVLWIIGLILLIAGIVLAFRGSLIFGIVLIVIGIILGALNIF